MCHDAKYDVGCGVRLNVPGTTVGVTELAILIFRCKSGQSRIIEQAAPLLRTLLQVLYNACQDFGLDVVSQRCTVRISTHLTEHQDVVP